jgi:hypothetical protein
MPVRLDFILDRDRSDGKRGGPDHHLIGEPWPLLPLLDLISELEGVMCGAYGSGDETQPHKHCPRYLLHHRSSSWPGSTGVAHSGVLVMSAFTVHKHLLHQTSPP